MDLNELTGGDKPATQPETPAPTPTPEPAPSPVANSGEPAAPPAAADQDKMVPLSALDAERKGRKDWKEKYLRMEGETALLKHQLEEARRASQPAPAQRQVQEAEFPDPIIDPQGYRDAVVGLARQSAMNERLTSQEESVKEKHGTDAVEAAWTRFSAAAQASPALRAEIGGARNPWAKLMEWDKKQAAQAEIGDDPAAFREKLEKEIREKIAAESGQQPTPTNPGASPPLNIPSSLATAPNVGNRGVPQFTGPSPLTDFVRTPRH